MKRQTVCVQSHATWKANDLLWANSSQGAPAIRPVEPPPHLAHQPTVQAANCHFGCLRSAGGSAPTRFWVGIFIGEVAKRNKEKGVTEQRDINEHDYLPLMYALQMYCTCSFLRLSLEKDNAPLRRIWVGWGMFRGTLLFLNMLVVALPRIKFPMHGDK